MEYLSFNNLILEEVVPAVGPNHRLLVPYPILQYTKATETMGGDDLGSDDEFLVEKIRADSDDESSVEQNNDKQADVSGDDDDDDEPTPLKRSNPEEPIPSSTPNKKRKRDIDDPLRDPSIGNSSAQLQSKHLSKFAGVPFLPQHVSKSPESDAPGMMKRIQAIISKKKLKQWKNKSSPCVIVVCLSARRAVQVLKELAPFNVRVSKLFAKHLTVEEQVKQLQESACGIAVGTPHRILTLAQKGALSFQHTQCVVLDTYQNDKRFAVYTLPDTAPHTRDLLEEFVFPQCQRKQSNLKVTFL
eukprot:Nitzschia sp. Nitz4//scaffold17_size182527//129422//130394//NITZ4_001870-RA/size182527-snap-gene-0.301-mRNA-1//-1//CDS//3329539388//4901//frame0